MKKLQTEKIPDEYCKSDNTSHRASVSHPSYWAKCYDEYTI